MKLEKIKDLKIKFVEGFHNCKFHEYDGQSCLDLQGGFKSDDLERLGYESIILGFRKTIKDGVEQIGVKLQSLYVKDKLTGKGSEFIRYLIEFCRNNDVSYIEVDDTSITGEGFDFYGHYGFTGKVHSDSRFLYL